MCSECVDCVGEGPHTPTRFSMPLATLGEKKYYLGIFFKVIIMSTAGPSHLLFLAGQLVQGRAVLQVPRDASRQHQLRRGAEEPGGPHHQLRWVIVTTLCAFYNYQQLGGKDSRPGAGLHFGFLFPSEMEFFSHLNWSLVAQSVWTAVSRKRKVQTWSEA